ncbi:MAG: helix-turn-helix domain-containing protein [Planctomycetes bacterium]|nr:helix-turn-helix domain-containing protein [Planctomycetota bacterium]
MPALRVNTVVQEYCSADWRWDTRRNLLRDLDLWVVLDGEGKLETSSGEYRLEAGDSFLLHRGEGYLGTHNPRKPLYVIAAHFDYLGKGGRVLHPEASALPVFHHRFDSLAFCAGMLERMHESWRREDGEGTALWLGTILYERERQRERDKLGAVTSELERRIHVLAREILKHPEQEWRVEKIAGEVFCSRHHFARKFKEMMGQSPNGYIIRARVMKAQALLRSSSHPVGRVAEILGYRDVYFFSRQFSKITGCTPTEYRRGEGFKAS